MYLESYVETWLQLATIVLRRSSNSGVLGNICLLERFGALEGICAFLRTATGSELVSGDGLYVISMFFLLPSFRFHGSTPTHGNRLGISGGGPRASC